MPVVVVQTGTEDFDVPYVLATDVVKCPPGAGFPVEEIAAAVAARLGEAGTGLAARVPVLREPLCQELIESFSRKNGILAVAIFVPGADFPVLTLNQIRLVLRIGAAHGVEIDQQRLPEVLATIGAGFGFRTVARQLLAAIPVAGWAVKGGIAYGGTRALGEAGDALLPERRRLRRRCREAAAFCGLRVRAAGSSSVRSGSYGSGNDREGGGMVGSEHAEELLQIEEADAWFEYLEATRAQNETRYAELEPWAWARLSQRLRAVRARRARLRPAAA